MAHVLTRRALMIHRIISEPAPEPWKGWGDSVHKTSTFAFQTKIAQEIKGKQEALSSTSARGID